MLCSEGAGPARASKPDQPEPRDGKTVRRNWNGGFLPQERPAYRSGRPGCRMGFLRRPGRIRRISEKLTPPPGRLVFFSDQPLFLSYGIIINFNFGLILV